MSDIPHHTIIEVDLTTGLHDYLRAKINSNKEILRARAVEAHAVATAEHRIYQRKLDEANRDNANTLNIYEIMKDTGVATQEVVILTGHPVSAIIPKIKSLMVRKQDTGRIAKFKEAGTVIYRIIDQPSQPEQSQPDA